LTTTPFLGLNIYDTASGSAVTFLTYRLTVDGLSSNTTILDTFANATSASISALRSNPVPGISLTQISSNYYEGTNVTVTGYMTNMMVSLFFDTTNSGSTTININGLGVKNLRKINPEGSKVSLASGDVVLNSYYLTTYDGIDFVLMSVAGGVSSALSGIPFITGSPSGLLDSELVLTAGTNVTFTKTSNSLTINAPTSGCAHWAIDAPPSTGSALDDNFVGSFKNTLWSNYNYSYFDYYNDDFGVYIDKYSAGSSTNISGIYQALPSGSSTNFYSCTVRIGMTPKLVIDSTYGQGFTGLGLFESASNTGCKVLGFGLQYSATGSTTGYGIQVWQGVSGSWTGYAQNDKRRSEYAYLRIQRNGSGSATYRFSSSLDGRNWTLWPPIDPGFEPQHIGLVFENESSGSVVTTTNIYVRPENFVFNANPITTYPYTVVHGRSIT
jgi:hypothetical protein